ncbi:hypothetical protein Vadar_012028 [Vaccinium darrowii]|uniref:Uncharacterized protein n=1 Tax=Vaccinium darrowii TaxID=229202 RepID=A0ACB7XGV2_9ERIC|nr:hypothetical protein Vadar_012028 [Vaccinium darrowii]
MEDEALDTAKAAEVVAAVVVGTLVAWGLIKLAVGVGAFVAWGLTKLVSSSGSEDEKTDDQKMMKAPGRDYRMPRNEFDESPSNYFHLYGSRKRRSNEPQSSRRSRRRSLVAESSTAFFLLKNDGRGRARGDGDIDTTDPAYTSRRSPATGDRANNTCADPASETWGRGSIVVGVGVGGARWLWGCDRGREAWRVGDRDTEREREMLRTSK